MTELAVALLTALPVGRAALWGHRVGARRMARWARSAALHWAVALTVIATGYALGWYWPCGLITPLVIGLLCTVAVRTVTCRRRGRRPPAASTPPGRGDSTAGLLVGAAAGSLLAGVAWLLLLLIGGVAASRPHSENPQAAADRSDEWLARLAETAHRGFVRHLPVVGPVADEVEALVFILNASAEEQREIARLRSWDELAKLPAMRAALADQGVMAQIEGLRTGDLLALYRLQKEPKVLALVQDPALRDAADGLRPTTIAGEIRREVGESESPGRAERR